MACCGTICSSHDTSASIDTSTTAAADSGFRDLDAAARDWAAPGSVVLTATTAEGVDVGHLKLESQPYHDPPPTKNSKSE